MKYFVSVVSQDVCFGRGTNSIVDAHEYAKEMRSNYNDEVNITLLNVTKYRIIKEY